MSVAPPCIAECPWSMAATWLNSPLRRRVLTFTGGVVNETSAGTLPAGGNGSLITDIAPAQFAGNAAVLNHSVAAPCWQGLWIPAFDAGGTAGWALGIGSAGTSDPDGPTRRVHAADIRDAGDPHRLRRRKTAIDASPSTAAPPGPGTICTLCPLPNSVTTFSGIGYVLPPP